MKRTSSGNYPLFLLRFLNYGLQDTLFGARGVVIADLRVEMQGLEVLFPPTDKYHLLTS